MASDIPHVRASAVAAFLLGCLGLWLPAIFLEPECFQGSNLDVILSDMCNLPGALSVGHWVSLPRPQLSVDPGGFNYFSFTTSYIPSIYL